MREQAGREGASAGMAAFLRWSSAASVVLALVLVGGIGWMGYERAADARYISC